VIFLSGSECVHVFLFCISVGDPIIKKGELVPLFLENTRRIIVHGIVLLIFVTLLAITA
jgi:hypothetical protein